MFLSLVDIIEEYKNTNTIPDENTITTILGASKLVIFIASTALAFRDNTNKTSTSLEGDPLIENKISVIITVIIPINTFDLQNQYSYEFLGKMTFTLFIIFIFIFYNSMLHVISFIIMVEFVILYCGFHFAFHIFDSFSCYPFLFIVIISACVRAYVISASINFGRDKGNYYILAN